MEMAEGPPVAVALGKTPILGCDYQRADVNSA
jgi:hypothetical protein